MALPDAAVDSLPHLLPVLVPQGVRPNEALGDPDRTERKRMDLVDDRPGGEDDLHASATDVHHRRGAPVEVEMPRGAAERQLGLFVTGDDLDSDLVPPQTSRQKARPFAASRTALVAMALISVTSKPSAIAFILPMADKARSTASSASRPVRSSFSPRRTISRSSSRMR